MAVIGLPDENGVSVHAASCCTTAHRSKADLLSGRRIARRLQAPTFLRVPFRKRNSANATGKVLHRELKKIQN
jgi:hypothetical protein